MSDGITDFERASDAALDRMGKANSEKANNSAFGKEWRGSALKSTYRGKFMEDCSREELLVAIRLMEKQNEDFHLKIEGAEVKNLKEEIEFLKKEIVIKDEFIDRLIKGLRACPS